MIPYKSMTELKTLKDLMYGCSNYPNCTKECESIDKQTLRLEAMKWIKYWRSLSDYCFLCNKTTIQDFMHFFNIKEEELK